MLGLVRDSLPTAWHVRLFPAYDAVRSQLQKVERFVDRRTMSESEFVHLLKDLGFKPGATVIVYSAFSLVRRRVPGITPEKLIRHIQDLITPDGTLLMP